MKTSALLKIFIIASIVILSVSFVSLDKAHALPKDPEVKHGRVEINHPDIYLL